MVDNLELYQEEIRTELINLNEGVAELAKRLDTQLESYVAPPSNVQVTGKVEVNTEKEVTVDNLTEVVDELKQLSKTLSAAIKDNSYAPVDKLVVTNIKDAKAETVKISNLTELKEYISEISKAIADNKPIVNVAKQDIVFPTAANKPIAVRLSNGKSFYNAIMAAVSAATPEVDPLAGYQICERDDAGATKYYGYAKANGAWYILRESSTGSYRYTQRGKLAATLGDVWADRASLEYGYIYEVF